MASGKRAKSKITWTTGNKIAAVVVSLMAVAIVWVVVAASTGMPPFSKSKDEANSSRAAKSESRTARSSSASSASGSSSRATSKLSSERAAMLGDYPAFKIPTIDGRTIRLNDYKGKVIVVDFWATWCPPCREETPKLVSIAKENRARGVEVIGLHIDDNGRSSMEDIRNFMKQYGITYTVGLASDEVFVGYLGTEDDTIPQTLVFDRSGRLIKHLIGFSPDHSRELDEAINQALSQS